jgi:hypothetical protein
MKANERKVEGGNGRIYAVASIDCDINIYRLSLKGEPVSSEDIVRSYMGDGVWPESLYWLSMMI